MPRDTPARADPTPFAAEAATPANAASPPGDPPSTARAAHDGAKPAQQQRAAAAPAPAPLSLSPESAATPKPSDATTLAHDAVLDDLAAQILEARRAHQALKQAHLAELSLGALKNRLRILRVDREKIEAVDHEADPKQAATRLVVRAEKPPAESWRVQAALQKEHDAAHRLASAKQHRLKEAQAGNLRRAEELRQSEAQLKVAVGLCVEERLRTVLADEQQMLRGEQLNKQLHELTRELAELTASAQYADAKEVEDQIEDAKAQLHAIAHSMRPHHLAEVHESPVSKSASWQKQRSVRGTARTRSTNPFGSKTHIAPIGWHGRSWHYAAEKQPSPDRGAMQAAERSSLQVGINTHE